MALTQVQSGILADSTQTYGMKNRIINGAMVIDQRNAGAAVTTNDSFPVDRFKFSFSTSNGAFSAQQSTTAPTGFINSLKFTTTTADSALAATEFSILYQVVEGLNFSDFAWGTASALPVTLSFWVRSSATGTFGGALQNSAGNRSYPFTYTINAIDTWEQKSITVAGDTSGTWLTTNGVGVYVILSQGCGTTRSGTAGSWASANYLSATGAVSLMQTLNATFYITGVQLEKGTTATSFDYRPYGTELALCQRYYQRHNALSSYTDFGMGVASGTTVASICLKYTTSMRASPTIAVSNVTLSDGMAASTVTSLSTNFPGSDSALIQAVVASGLTQFRPYQLQANNNTAAYVEYSSEL